MEDELRNYETWIKGLSDHPFWYRMFRVWCELNKIEPTSSHLMMWLNDEIPEDKL